MSDGDATRGSHATLRCHAGADHGPVTYRGVFGDLCEVCLVRVIKVQCKVLGHKGPPGTICQRCGELIEPRRP